LELKICIWKFALMLVFAKQGSSLGSVFELCSELQTTNSHLPILNLTENEKLLRSARAQGATHGIPHKHHHSG